MHRMLGMPHLSLVRLMTIYAISRINDLYRMTFGSSTIAAEGGAWPRP